jgi:urea carboxylase
MFSKVLIANRGEIACRVIRTCKRLNVKTVAVYSEADAGALHTQLADESFLIGPAPAAQSYLNGDKLIELAKQTGAEGIHPGYGFLSENPEFAEACTAAGIKFIGPTPEAMREFSHKHTSRARAVKLGVPVTPGTGLIADEAEAIAAAEAIGYPVMVKATAGGGGIGMSKCFEADQLKRALADAKRKGESFFKHSGVYIEKFVANPHHIEVQIFGTEGRVVHVGERECSIQRRNQKLVEETASPLATPEFREAVTSAAVKLAESVGYRSAGTVEFIAGDDRQFYFLEMNTRLQVEHGVTELCSGLDLVEWMLKEACGELDLTDYQHQPKGHAIELRLYAENPAKKFLPSPGKVTAFSWHAVPGLRVDTWVAPGTTITPYYDPLIAKIMMHASTRAEAIEQLAHALEGFTVEGLTCNLGLFKEILANGTFRAGHTTTAFLRDVLPYEK